ncbi:hypothetical protein Q4S45_03275 [Massilia sp. R2A-15]|uniref:hypothetical protein n=1 Tax=Massilia sp. R2A-15 TaxID=3064278 RepID=UPI0027330E01|nr:hypothetical protein [Massilia sp. R2A-15]WLI90159.1 hypothetical protein Q4S45_03275 [Massilia sp. R2A-15]
MQVLKKTLLAQVAGGFGDELEFNHEDGSGSGGDAGGWGNWDNSSNEMFGAGGSSNDGPASLALNFGSVQANVGGSGFDSNGVGPNSCVAQPPAGGLFGMTMTETLGAAAGATAAAAGIGGGWGASAAIEAAGGFGQIGTMGSAAVGVTSAALVGVVASASVGVGAGALLYGQSEIVQDVSQTLVGAALEAVEDVKEVGAWVLGIEHKREPVFHP